MKDKLYEGLLFAYYGELLNPHQREIMRLYFECDMSLAEISEEMDITRQGVRDIIVRSTAKLEETESKLGLVFKIKKISNLLEEMIETSGFTPEQKDKAEKLLREIKEI